jgi:epoxyqueuosine reductase
MEPANLNQQLEANLRNRGFPIAIGAIEHLEDLKQELERHLHHGLISQGIFQECFSHFKFSYTGNGKKLVSIIITAAAQPQQGVIFRFKGEEYHYLVPPTYSGKTDEIVKNIIIKTISPHGFSLFPAVIPLKLAAVRMGLSKYGRNNITYCENMGSYYRLQAFLSDFPVFRDYWREPELMSRCESCTACLKSCPTGAINRERMLLRIERCLTYHNERPGDFPAWIEKSWHNCLVGCMFCQTVCPENKKIAIQPGADIDFSEEETGALLEAGKRNDLPRSVKVKLAELDLLEDWQMISRNLGVLLMSK